MIDLDITIPCRHTISKIVVHTYKKRGHRHSKSFVRIWCMSLENSTNILVVAPYVQIKFWLHAKVSPQRG